MYRAMLKEEKDLNIYCDVWPCDRECGKFHKRFLNTTKLRQTKTVSESMDNTKVVQENREKAKSIFEEIMEAAARKDSQQFVEKPVPPLPEEFRSMTLGPILGPAQGTSSNADTTTIYFDNPVWDNAKFRQELDSDDEKYSIGAAPYIMDDDDTLDDILRDTQHEATSNPIQHYQRDETILTDDEHDYSTLNLSKPMNDNARQPRGRQPNLQSPDAEYEKSLTDL